MTTKMTPVHILIAEDSRTQAEQLKFILTGAGYQVSVANSGEQALDMLQSHSFQLVISDIMMPGISGYQLCKQIKQTLPELPVVLLTTRRDPMDIFYGLEAGADNFQTKPYNEANLLHRISFILENRALKRQGKLQSGQQVAFLGNIFTINSDKEQILDLLISAFEDAVNANQALEYSKTQLAAANQIIEKYARQLEGKVRSAEQHHSAIVNGINEGIITLNTQGNIESVNPAAAHMFSNEDETLIGKTFFSCLTDDSLQLFQQMLAQCQQGKPSVPAFKVSGKQNGQILPLNVLLNRIQLNDQDVFVVILRDLSKEQQAEEKLRHAQKMEAIGQLTGGIAHDFNNLLSIIFGNAELLLEDFPDNTNVKGSANNILAAAERGADLTNRLLAFARKQPLRSEPTNIVASVNQLNSILARTLGENIDIQIHHDKALWLAEVDKSQLENSLLNLAINARDAMPNGGKLIIENANVVIDDDLAASETDIIAGDYVMLTVTDTGCGIPAGLLSKVFDPFFTTKDVGKGSGLGLSMVYGFVKQSRGHIRIYSELGIGTSIKLYFPRAKAQADVSDKANLLSPLPHGKESILLVEDDELVRQMVIVLLQTLGYQVIATTCAREALDVLRTTQDINLLFTDIVMPGGISGIELAQQVRQSLPDLPVLFTTGYTENTIINNYTLPQRSAIIGKPYRRQNLAVVIRDMLDSKPRQL